MSAVKFNNVDTLFSKNLKSKINHYFLTHNKRKTGNSSLFLKATILLGALFLMYFLLVFTDIHYAIKIPLCVLFGFNLAAIGFNIMHDAGHNSFSDNKQINTLLSYTLNMLGGNIYFWKLKHNIAHHTYTNIEGEDHDIEIKFMRVHHDQARKKYHKYQRFYFPLLYSISYLAWIFYQDYEKYFQQKMSKEGDQFHFPLQEKIIFWVSKVLHFLVFVVVPSLVVGVIPTLIGIVIISVICGFTLATVFQLAHVVTTTDFKSTTNNRIEEEWMIHQIQSTSNFATRNKFLTWVLGGLNHQVEHHLFPKISHIHYPALNKILKETCAEFKIQYNEYKTMQQAFLSHLTVIKQLS